VGYALSKDYKSVAQIIREDMSEEEREQLGRNLMNFIEGLEITDLTFLLPLIMRNSGIFKFLL
jgi:hypothetical protein